MTRAPLDRDMVHDQRNTAQACIFRPVGHRPAAPAPAGGGAACTRPQRAGDRVPVVLRDRRGHRRGIDDLVRRGHAEVLGLREVPAAGACPLREQRLRVVRVIAPGQVRAGSAGLLALLPLPVAALRFGAGAVFPGRSSADGGIPEFPEFRDTARSSLASRSSSSATLPDSSPFRASRTSISTP